MTLTIDPATLVLAPGSHSDGPPPGDPGCELCLWEAYNLLLLPPDSDPEITDRCPDDVSPVLHQYALHLNDCFGDAPRQALKAFLPAEGKPSPLAGTRDDQDEARSYLALDWLIRTYTPAWLDLAGLSDEARALRELRQIVDLVAAQSARPVVLAAREVAQKKWYAAGYAARSAAGYAGYAAWYAARSAAGYAGYAAWYAAGYAAWYAAGYAAWYAAGYAAEYAARSAAGRTAADDALAPTVAQLQDSAIDLLRRMIHPAPAE